MSFRKRPLLILLWKHSCERRRRLCHTIWEITCCTLIFWILFLIRQHILFADTDLNANDESEYQLSELYFAPSSEWTNQLVSIIVRRLKLSQGKSLPDTKGYRGFTNEEEILKYIQFSNITSLNHVAVIIIENKDAWPAQLRYKLYLIHHHGKSKDVHLRTQNYLMDKFSLDVTRHVDPAAVRLQQLIDRTYLELLTHEDTRHFMDDIEAVPSDTHISRNLEVIHNYLIICTILAPLPFFLYNSTRLLDERRSGLKELMKLVGVTSNTLRLSHFLDTLFMGTVYSIVVTFLLKITSTAILPHSNGVIIMVTLIFHFLNVTSLAFISIKLSQDYQHSNGVALLIYLLTYILNNIWYSQNLHKTPYIYLISWLVPHAPIYLFWNEVIVLEKNGVGTTITNIWMPHSTMFLPVALVWWFFIVHLCLMFMLAWYIDMVRPGRYGVAKNWKFIFQEKFWIPKKKRRKVNFHVTAEQVVHLLRDHRFFEKPEKQAEVAIKIADVKKVYCGWQRRVVALKHVSLDVFKGEITVLLGANGSGKSSLLSIVTGMCSATNGVVYVNGLDTSARLQEVSQDLGLCPQHNITFKFLSVRENIMFFEMLKGSTKKEALANAKKLMSDIKIDEKSEFYSDQLSTGGKRCLQIACALAGGADVLVLDEPTSGMDADAKHSFWDLLLVMRGHKTVLISTTCMEEADALGDRIAILDAGRLRCHGTPQFLKQAIGGGFNLSLFFKHEPNMGDIENIFNVIPNATMNIIDKKRVNFILPISDMGLFGKLFDNLDSSRNELAISSISLGMSIEDMFLRFIHNDELDEATLVSADHEYVGHCVSGFDLRVQQCKTLLKRNFTFLWTKKIQFLLLQVLVPVVGFIIVTLTTNTHFGYGHFHLNNTNIKTSSLQTVFYDVDTNKKSNLIERLRGFYPNVEFVQRHNVHDDISRGSTEGRFDSNKIVGIHITDNGTKVFYPNRLKELAPFGINLLSNMLLSAYLPFDDYSINVYRNTPSLQDYPKVYSPKSALLSYSWILYIVFLVNLPLAPTVWTSVHDLRKGARYSHIIAGCPSHLHWLTKLTSDMTIYVVIVPPTVLMCASFLDFDMTFTQTGYMVALLVLLLVYGVAFLCHMYFLSFFLNNSNATSQVYIIVLCLGVVMRLFTDLFNAVESNIRQWTCILANILSWLSSLSPIYVFSSILVGITLTARLNALCLLNKHKCPALMVDNIYFSEKQCCATKPGFQMIGYYELDSDLFQLLILVLQAFVYFGLLLLLQNRKLLNLIDHMLNCMYSEPAEVPNDIFVSQEKESVKQKIHSLKESGKPDNYQNVLLVHNLHKNYTGLYQRTKMCNSVKGISFFMRKGECLAIMGANGAGKTTTLNMLTGYTAITRGDAYANGYCIKKQRNNYLRSIAFSLQTGGLDEYLSGYENLLILAKLHGFTPSSARHEALFWLSYMGLSSEGDAVLDTYSAGCSRRLTTAAALMSAPCCALLDEPIESVDASTRPLLTRALQRALERNVALLVATHSMDWKEIETLCDRIAILSKGELAAIGTARQIRSNYASGFTARIKLRVARVLKILSQISIDADDDTKSVRSFSSLDSIQQLKIRFKECFTTSTLVDEHLSMLYYHISDSTMKILYSEMFEKLELLKNEFKVIEDYSLSETTIDEVFCHFKQCSHV